MKCKKCNKKNVRQAHYCTYCGNPFSEKEREENKEKGIIALFLRIKDWYDTITLSQITGSLGWKIGTIIGVLIIGIIIYFNNGSSFKILDSSDYQFRYNVELKEYYVYAKDNEIKLNLYTPKQVNSIYLISYNKDNEELDKEEITYLNDLKVKLSNDKVSYYKVSLDKKESKRNTIKLYVFQK